MEKISTPEKTQLSYLALKLKFFLICSCLKFFFLIWHFCYFCEETQLNLLVGQREKTEIPFEQREAAGAGSVAWRGQGQRAMLFGWWFLQLLLMLICRKRKLLFYDWKVMLILTDKLKRVRGARARRGQGCCEAAVSLCMLLKKVIEPVTWRCVNIEASFCCLMLWSHDEEEKS